MIAQPALRGPARSKLAPPDASQALLAAVMMDARARLPELQALLDAYVNDGQQESFNLSLIAATHQPLSFFSKQAFQTYSLPVDNARFIHMGLSAGACKQLLEAALGPKAAPFGFAGTTAAGFSAGLEGLAGLTPEQLHAAEVAAASNPAASFSVFEQVWLNALLHEWVQGPIQQWLVAPTVSDAAHGNAIASNPETASSFVYLHYIVSPVGDSLPAMLLAADADAPLEGLMLACPASLLHEQYGLSAERYSRPSASPATQSVLDALLDHSGLESIRLRIGKTRIPVQDVERLESGDVVILENSSLNHMGLVLNNQPSATHDLNIQTWSEEEPVHWFNVQPPEGLRI
ncbi:MAG: FliM/FliN family flagellar motor C-terminal domain-containing protein [Vampirovibrionales bacterium]|nr:FliM/FliN family flagellar motor C-terminal domain-containing protein [Vampirovibrionales bacterium]